MNVSITHRIDGSDGIAQYHLSNGMHVTRAVQPSHSRSKFLFGLFAPAPGGRSPGLPTFLGVFPTLQGAVKEADYRQRKADANLTRMAYSKE